MQLSCLRGATPLDVLLIVLGTIGAIAAGAALAHCNTASRIVARITLSIRTGFHITRRHAGTGCRMHMYGGCASEPTCLACRKIAVE